jgi:acyl dehydratase
MDQGRKLSWEDFHVGRTWTHGYQTVTEADIVSFARQYDPLAIHVDPALARESPLGVFCASGIHTLAIAQRLLCEAILLHTRLVAGGGIDEVRMRVPVVPGDSLGVRIRVGDAWPHARRTECAWIVFLIDVLRHDERVVLDYRLTVLIQRAKHSSASG